MRRRVRGPLLSQPDTKLCPECGNEVKQAAVICRFCRHQFGESSTPSRPEADQLASQDASRRRLSSPLLLVLTLVGLALAGVLLYYAMSNGSTQEAAQSPTLGETTTPDRTSIMTTPAKAPPPQEQVVIEPYGIGVGVVDLFDDAETAVPRLEAALGPPDSDATERCLGTIGPLIRTLRWADFAVHFSADSDAGLVGFTLNSFQAEGATPTGIETAEGIGLGSTVAEVKAAYAQATFSTGAYTGFVLDENANPTLRGAVTELSQEGEVTALFISPEGCEGE